MALLYNKHEHLRCPGHLIGPLNHRSGRVVTRALLVAARLYDVLDPGRCRLHFPPRIPTSDIRLGGPLKAV